MTQRHFPLVLRKLVLPLAAASLAAIAAEPEGDAPRHWPPVPKLGPDMCGPLKVFGRHGPYDYRNPPPEAILDNVEFNHFNGHLAAMVRGKDEYFGPGGGPVASGFGYTLHAFPNHHRALKAMDDYSRKKGFNERPRGAERTVECYFERAIRFRPNDVVARYLYANYLEGRKRREDADRELALIAKDVMDRPQLAYNVGLLYAQRGDFDKAREYARVAYRQGANLPGLKAMLVQKGKWDPAVDESAPATPAEPPATAAQPPANATEQQR